MQAVISEFTVSSDKFKYVAGFSRVETRKKLMWKLYTTPFIEMEHVLSPIDVLMDIVVLLRILLQLLFESNSRSRLC